MQQSRTQVEDLRLEGERRLKYKGTARINLDVLHFKWNQPRELNSRHVENLKERFRKEGCRRLPVRKHVPAIIDQQCLDAVMRDSGVPGDQLLTNPPNEYPELVFPRGFQLECLHGRHRIQAGREFLSPRDKWWTVDLYLSGKIRALTRDKLTTPCQISTPT